MYERIRTITVPKDSEAMLKLDMNTAEPSSLLEHDFDEEAFRFLQISGVFSLINSACSSLIDDGEYEGLVGEEVLLSGNAVLMEMYQSAPPKLRVALTPITRLFREAIKRRTGVFFFFERGKATFVRVLPASVCPDGFL